jgi:hypothetical protein
MAAADSEVSFSRNAPKHDICLSLLTEGNVNSFVDLFYLSHRLTDAVYGPGGELLEPPRQVTMAETELRFLRGNLVAAEAAARIGDARGIFDSHQRTAEAFARQGDHKLAVYFFEKCLQGKVQADTQNLWHFLFFSFFFFFFFFFFSFFLFL